MVCPYCGCKDTIVMDKRNRGDRAIRRRRQCKSCGKRWSTIEMVDSDYNQIINAIKEGQNG